MKSLLSNISFELNVLLNESGHKRCYGRGQQIFAEGETAHFLPIVISGSVKMIRTPALGREVIIGVFHEGEMFAIPPVFDGAPYPASAFATADSVILQIDRLDFLKILRESSEFSFEVIRWMCEMLREKSAMIRNLAIRSPEQRIGYVLVKLAEDQRAAYPVTINARRQDIAEMTSLTTETTIRVIRRFADQKMVRIDRGKIILDDVETLRRYLQT